MTSARREICLRIDDVVVGDSFKDDGRDQVVATYSQEGVYKGTWISLLVHPDPGYIGKPKVKWHAHAATKVRVWRVLDVPEPELTQPLLAEMQEYVDTFGYSAFKELIMEIHTS